MITIEDYNQIGYNLQCFHEIFYKFWKIGSPVISKDVETCQIHFDSKGETLEFRFNPDFWDKCDNYERAYFIAHECTHVILNHGKRAGLNQHVKSKDMAVDIVANQMLLNNLFLYTTDNIKKHNIFLEDLVDQGIEMAPNHSFEYYYNILQKEFKDENQENSENGLPINDHSYLADNTDRIIEKSFGLQKGDLNDQDKTKAENYGRQGGTETLDKVFQVYNTKTYRVPNWQFLFKKIVKDYRGKFEAESNKVDWLHQDRRIVLLNSGIILPNYVGEKPKNKINMWFFQDVSGSCLELRDKFISLARKIPTDIFNIKYHTFDTQVKEIPITTKEIIGGGGTDFQCIENYIIEETINKDLKYPEVVVHLTDGCSYRPITPLKPRNHFWLLTENYVDYIPKESFRLILDDFHC